MNLAFETLKCTLNNDILTIQLNRGKVNAINTLMVCELINAIEIAQSEAGVRAVILTGREGCFTAGLDLKDLVMLDEEGVEYFWRSFHKLILNLVRLDKPVLSAISGHSPAGGCVLAICSDFRIMLDGDFTIGLNELAVGIPVPALIYELMSVWVGRRHAYQNLMTAKLLTPTEALEQGLVDELVTMDELDSRARRRIEAVLNFPEHQWSMTKRNLRFKLDAVLNMSFEDVFNQALQNWWRPETRATLLAVVSRLSGR